MLCNTVVLWEPGRRHNSAGKRVDYLKQEPGYAHMQDVMNAKVDVGSNSTLAAHKSSFSSRKFLDNTPHNTRPFMTRGYKARTNRSPSTNAGPESWSRVKHVGS